VAIVADSGYNRTGRVLITLPGAVRPNVCMETRAVSDTYPDDDDTASVVWSRGAENLTRTLIRRGLNDGEVWAALTAKFRGYSTGRERSY
jgi:hypothetical protein